MPTTHMRPAEHGRSLREEEWLKNDQAIDQGRYSSIALTGSFEHQHLAQSDGQLAAAAQEYPRRCKGVRCKIAEPSLTSAKPAKCNHGFCKKAGRVLFCFNPAIAFRHRHIPLVVFYLSNQTITAHLLG
uniref:Uncharacterized protein n=1 Tax=Ectopseudomonas mendocina (strain ymp) TaxID=399739 RepID=A4XN93_ECTM1